jgi:hypothetical protein
VIKFRQFAIKPELVTMQKIHYHLLSWLISITLLAGCADRTANIKPITSDSQQSSGLRTEITQQGMATADKELISLAANVRGSCNLVVDPKKAQYIIGYGSLMQDESRNRSASNTGTAYPVRVTGYRRGWFAKGGSVGFDTTYLGLVPDQHSTINAVIYKINAVDIPTIDKREYFYCRLAVNPASYLLLKQETPMSLGQVWIYVNKPESIATPNTQYPIVQSYVDIFVSGCQEQEERYALRNFAKECLDTTSNWSTAWVNDRLYPRRPFIYQPKAGKIDNLLKQHLPVYFQQIHIESTN